MSVQVGILMGSISDKEVMQAAADGLDRFGIGYEWRVMSAHRTPAAAQEFCSSAKARGLQVLICGAGMAAHLAGAAAAHSTLPVIGVPIAASLDGMDALLATVQMPPGLPVATVSIGRAGAKNAAILAAQILALSDPALAQALIDDRAAMRAKIEAADAELQRR
jgi:phosphoribosylaminoimidazole carboxylase PurE protein